MIFALILILAFALGRIMAYHPQLSPVYLEFGKGLLLPAMVFYFMVAFEPHKHEWKLIFYLVVGFIIFEVIISTTFGAPFWYKIIGSILSAGICSITFIDRVNRWFMKASKSKLQSNKL